MKSSRVPWLAEITPTLVTSCTALPPRGPLRLRPGRAGSAPLLIPTIGGLIAPDLFKFYDWSPHEFQNIPDPLPG